MTTSFRDFSVGGIYGMTFARGLGGDGRGPGGTRYRITPMSSTKKKTVPTKKGTTNPLSLMRFQGNLLSIHDFALDGTPQGHPYNGLRVERSRTVNLRELAISYVPGTSDINPGETFALNCYRCHNIQLGDTEIDGGAIGASGLGLNTCDGGLLIERMTAHDLRYCKGIAMWKQEGGGLIRQYQSLNNAFAIGLERCNGLYRIVEPKFRGSTRADIHLANDGGQYGRATVMIIDPDLKPGQKIRVLLPKKELGFPNRQTMHDVSVLVDGRDRSDELLEFVARA